MEIRVVEKGNGKAVMSLSGRVDSNNAPRVLQEFARAAAEYREITLDMEKLEYVSSAGLRALLTLYKSLQRKKGELVLSHVSDDVAEILELTGFMDLMNVQK